MMYGFDFGVGAGWMVLVWLLPAIAVAALFVAGLKKA